jgi:hypothetical protein
VEITGPSGSTGFFGPSTVSQGNDVFRRFILFATVTAPDSGEYVCSVLVGSPAAVMESATAVLDAG